MLVKKIFVNTYRYDFHLAKICIASIRYWYPDIPVFLIKDEDKGRFSTSYTEKLWNIQVLNVSRRKFGWGYGKLEPLFLDNKEAFFVIDADAVITGPVLDSVKEVSTDFVVDKEVQPEERFNQIYYRLDKIHEIDNSFVYPGYSFNTGQWFGTSSILTRNDFEKTLNWTEPPSSKDPALVFNNDQAHLNFAIHRSEQQNMVTVSRTRLMIWPVNGNADFIELDNIKRRAAVYPLVIHWAGMSGKKLGELPRADILKFYRHYYYSKAGKLRFVADAFQSLLLAVEQKVNFRLGRYKRRSRNK